MNQVPPEGPLDAKIVIVGEAPGKTEVAEGRPFVGVSGQHLDRMLHTAKILRRECYITNVVKERPAGNDISKFITFSKGNVETTPEYDEYEDQLYNELSKLNPNIIIPLGQIALYAITRRSDIIDVRGYIFDGVTIPNVKAIPTRHPAAALYESILTTLIISDLQRAERESKFPEIRRPVRELIIEPRFDQVMEFLYPILGAEKTAFDIETRNGQVSCIAFTNCVDESMCIPFIYKGGDYFTIKQESDIWCRIGQILEDPKIVKITQNGCFDAGFLMRQYGIYTRNIEDTMVAQGVLYPDLPKKLGFLASAYTEQECYKFMGRHTGKIENWNDYWTYNATDAIVTLEVFPKQIERLENQKNLETYRRQVSIIPALLFMQEFGIKVDVEELRKEGKNVLQDIASLQRELDSIVSLNIGWSTLNVNSPKQCKEYFYQVYKNKPYRTKGRITTDRTALKRIIRKGERFGSAEAKIALKIRGLKKEYGTYLNMQFDDDSRMRSSYNPVGAKTGRLSSSKTFAGTGGNQQNLTPIIKKHMIADDGCIIIEIDLRQAENMIVAYLSNEESMIRAFKEGIDLHRQTYGMMFGIRTEEVSDVDGTSDIGDGTKSQRFWGKQTNHSLNYGRGYKDFGLKYEIPENEARRLIELYHSAYPAVRARFHADIKDQLCATRIVTNLMGRKRRFMGRVSDDMFRQAYGQIPQSTVADIINERGLAFITGGNSVFKDLQLLSQVHDSINFQFPISTGWNEIALAINMIATSLEKPIPFKTPFVIPAGVKMGVNMKEMVKISEVNAETLEQAYDKLNANT